MSIGDVRFLDRFDTQSGNLFHYVRYDCVPNIYGHQVVRAVIPLRKSPAYAAQLCGCLNPRYRVLPAKL